nr:DUF4221 family protein [uncultured Draconibacterium sp.]
MKYLALVFITIIIVSCNHTLSNKEELDKKNAQQLFSLVPQDKHLTFELNNRIVNRSVSLMPYTDKDSTRYLYYLSDYTNLICVFNIDEQKLEKIIKLEYNGPDGVGNVNGIEVISSDSIYVTSNLSKKLFLVNHEGKLISSIDYSKYKQDYLISAPTSRTLENMRMSFKDSVILLPFYPPVGSGNYKNTNPEDLRFIAVIDTADKKAETLNVGFPEDYWEDQYKPAWFGFIKAENRFYINYTYDDRILESKNGINWIEHVVKSKYANVNVKRKNELRAAYSRLMYDPFRRVFYRFVEHTQTNNGGRTRKDMVRFPAKFSVIILDSEMNKIGETIFPEDTYELNGYFVTQEGLYMSLSNPFNPCYDVNTLKFELLKLNKDEN